jgi:hypothetical protein
MHALQLISVPSLHRALGVPRRDLYAWQQLASWPRRMTTPPTGRVGRPAVSFEAQAVLDWLQAERPDLVDRFVRGCRAEGVGHVS